MDREQSSLLATWLTFGVSVLTLVVTVVAVGVATVALLSIEQVKEFACRQFSIDCGFEAANVMLWTLDADVRHTKPEDRPLFDQLPPGLNESLEPSEPPSSWDLLTAELKPDRTPADCLAISTLAPVMSPAGTTPELAGKSAQWKVTYVKDAVEEGYVSDGAQNPRSILLEFRASYEPLRRARDIHVSLRLLSAEFVNGDALTRYTQDYAITLPAPSDQVDLLCRIPKIPPGRYRLALATHSSEGDWAVSEAEWDAKFRVPVPDLTISTEKPFVSTGHTDPRR